MRDTCGDPLDSQTRQKRSCCGRFGENALFLRVSRLVAFLGTLVFRQCGAKKWPSKACEKIASKQIGAFFLFAPSFGRFFGTPFFGVGFPAVRSALLGPYSHLAHFQIFRLTFGKVLKNLLSAELRGFSPHRSPKPFRKFAKKLDQIERSEGRSVS